MVVVMMTKKLTKNSQFFEKCVSFSDFIRFISKTEESIILYPFLKVEFTRQR